MRRIDDYNDHYGRLLLALDPGDEPEDQQPLWENRRVAIHTGICNCTGCSNRKLVNVRARKPRAKK